MTTRQHNERHVATRDVSASRTEHGFTMIELIIVSVVLIVLMAIAVPTFIKQKQNSVRDGFVDAARSYQTAIEAFRIDNAGKPPSMADQNQWPTSSPDLAVAGPVNRLIDPNDATLKRKRKYMRNGVPDAMVSMKGTIGTAPGVKGTYHIQYVPGTTFAAPKPLEYSLVVTAGDNPPCFLGSDPVSADTNDSSAPFACDKKK